MLAIPPGYATAIFPASGVALAALLLWGWRLWPGVLLGSLGLNLWISQSVGQDFTATVFAISIGIGFGAAIQALVGAWLIHRFMGFPSALESEREVFRFLLLGGASCIVSASFGVFSLWSADLVLPENVLFSWWNWWVGDALGVLLGVPIILTFFGKPRSLWQSRRWSVSLPMGIVALGIIPIFVGASHWESQRVKLEFRKQAAQLHQSLENKIELNLEAIHSLGDYYHGVEQINFKRFTLFANGALSRNTSLHALSFNPRILVKQRATFENTMNQELDEHFAIKERTSGGDLIIARVRPEYVAVAYIQPQATNRSAIGFDVASNPRRKAALYQARDKGVLVASQSINLVQENQSQKGVLTFLPLYSDSATSLEERRERIIGYAVGVFRVGDLLASAIKGVSGESITARLYDKEPGLENSFLAGYGNGRGIWDKDTEQDREPGQIEPWWSEKLDFGGRKWSLELSPSRTALESQKSWGAWFVLAGGLLFACIVGAFQLIMTGRTARIEDLVLERTNQLADRESRLGAILENAGDGIITINKQAFIESANPAAGHLFGYNCKDLVGVNVNSIMPFPHWANLDDFINQAKVSGETSGLGIIREVEGIRLDGSAIPLDLSTSKVELAERQIFTIIIRDLTERKRADKLKNEFVSTVSHELRTPLTSIYAGLKMVLAGVTGEIPDKARKLVELAYNNSERLNLLINDILDIQKMESGMIDLKFKPVDAGKLIHRAVQTNAAYAEKFGVSYSIKPSVPEGLMVNGDEDRLMQVLANLLSNAAKFTESGDIVDVILEKTGCWVRFSVSDHGTGIPEDFQSRVFQKFTQADSSDIRSNGGTGLGLSISKALVENHHGEIGFITEPGAGSTFFFRLPYTG